jgi:hypothetical protein
MPALARFLLMLLTLATPAAAAGPSAFEFVALGDMPYTIPRDYERVDRLIAAINARRPSFSIHVGDIKSGSTPCTDEAFQKIADQFATFDGPLVYTPGDNEWTDCHRRNAGGYDILERLAKIRAMFYPRPDRSLGRTPMPVESQATVMPGHAAFVENVRFEKNGVLFVTLHVVGSNNSFESNHKLPWIEEFFARDRANEAWLEDSVRRAVATNARALVIAMQANVYDIRQTYPVIPPASGFVRTIRAISEAAKAFKRPILVVNGDEHTFEYLPMLGLDLKPIPNVMRLQVMGADLVHAVTVRVDPDLPAVFAVEPLIVPENVAN